MGEEKTGWSFGRPDAPLTPAFVERLLEPWRGQRVVAEVAQFRGGLMNRNYRVRLGADIVVLRFYDRDARAGVKETTILRQLSPTMRVPEVLHFDANPLDAAAPVAVLEFIDGITLRDLSRSGPPEAIAQAAFDTGHQLARLASVRLANPKILEAGTIDPSLLAQPNANARLIDHFLSSPIVCARLSAADIETTHGYAWSGEQRLTHAPRISSFAHGDFNSANILVKNGAHGWEVAAVIDWEFACSASIYVDIGNFLRYERPDRQRFEPAFSRGLADGGVDLPPDWRVLARLADLAALCELLTRSAAPDDVVDEVCDIVRGTTIAGAHA